MQQPGWTGWHTAARLFASRGIAHFSLELVSALFTCVSPAAKCTEGYTAIAIAWRFIKKFDRGSKSNRVQTRKHLFFLLRTCPSAAETQQCFCHGCFAGCPRLTSGRAPSEEVLQQALSPPAASRSCRAAFGIFAVAALGQERTRHRASSVQSCTLPSSPSLGLGALMKGQGAGRK